MPYWGTAARGIPTGVMTSGPTASDPTSSLPLPPAVANLSNVLEVPSSSSQDVRLRQRQRKRTIHRKANRARESSRGGEYYSAHPNLLYAGRIGTWAAMAQVRSLGTLASTKNPMAGFTNWTPLSHILEPQITKTVLVAQKRDTMASPSSIEPSPTEYRRFADECLRWADRVPRQDQKNTLVEMAKVWMHAALMMEYDHAHRGPPRDAQVP
jgi:hypothetical protein